MRISDWSSDVCSSDLVADLVGFAERHRDALGAGAGGAADAVHVGLRHVRQVEVDDVADLLHVDAAGRDVSRDQDRQPTLRSEEHTSELQSLMRISYAVFCLKKKKTNPHRQSSVHTIQPQKSQ